MSEFVVAMYAEDGLWKWLCSCGVRNKTKRSTSMSWTERNNVTGASVHLSMHFARNPPGRKRRPEVWDALSLPPGTPSETIKSTASEQPDGKTR